MSEMQELEVHPSRKILKFSNWNYNLSVNVRNAWLEWNLGEHLRKKAMKSRLVDHVVFASKESRKQVITQQISKNVWLNGYVYNTINIKHDIEFWWAIESTTLFFLKISAELKWIWEFHLTSRVNLRLRRFWKNEASLNVQSFILPAENPESDRWC